MYRFIIFRMQRNIRGNNIFGLKPAAMANNNNGGYIYLSCILGNVIYAISDMIPNIKNIFSGSIDGTVILWNIPQISD